MMRMTSAALVACALAGCAPAPNAPALAAVANKEASDARGQAGDVASADVTGSDVTGSDVTGPEGSGPRAVDHAVAGQDYRIAVRDDAAGRRFDLHLTSLSERELCLGDHAWPDNRGRLVSAADAVVLRAGALAFSMRDAGLEACGVACVRAVQPHGQLEGFIGYDQFPPEAFSGAGPRTLDISMQPYFCDSGELR